MCQGVVFPTPHTLPVGGRLPHFKDRWNKTLRLSPWHLQALEGVPIDWDRAPPENQPFDSALRYPPGSKERVSCTKTLQHYLAIGSVRPLPADTQDGLWSTFFPVDLPRTCASEFTCAHVHTHKCTWLRSRPPAAAHHMELQSI